MFDRNAFRSAFVRARQASAGAGFPAPAFALICALALAGCSQGAAPPTAPPAVPADSTGGDGTATTPGALGIKDVQVAVLLSYPAKILLHVTGEAPDACTDIDRVTQSRNGADVIVTITTRREGEACAQVVKRVTRDLLLEGSFAPGSYVVRVNGVERRFTV